ncbi:hypothetical protein V7114_06790 [Neobacillus niacini]
MIMDECKRAIKVLIDAELAQGTRDENIENELIHFIRRQIYERND